MDKTKELQTVKNIVKEVLENDIGARNSDDRLYFMVCKKMNEICIYSPFAEVMANRKKYGLPAFESVRRTRQKLQVEHPELAGCKEVTKERLANEEAFREFARS